MERRNFPFFLLTSVSAAVFLLGLPLGGCGVFGGTVEVRVSGPETGPQLPGGGNPAAWELSWLAGDGTVRSLHASSPNGIVLEVPKERPVVVTALPESPEWPASFRCRPAGCILPAVRTADDARLTWEDGFAADFLLQAAEAGMDPARINVLRFRDTARDRGDGRPWDLDANRLGGDVSSGGLWVYSFRLEPLVEVILDLPPGNWFRAYPPDEALRADGSGWSGQLSPGYHCFYRDGDGVGAEAWVDERGNAILLVE